MTADGASAVERIRWMVVAVVLVMASWLGMPGVALAQPFPDTDEQQSSPIVRIAELDIDPAYLDEYTAFLAEEIQTSIDVEPGVLSLYAVAIKGEPTKIRVFETYANMDAYYSHIASPHFLKYKNGTQHMVTNLTLLETDPILLGTRP